VLIQKVLGGRRVVRTGKKWKGRRGGMKEKKVTERKRGKTQEVKRELV